MAGSRTGGPGGPRAPGRVSAVATAVLQSWWEVARAPAQAAGISVSGRQAAERVGRAAGWHLAPGSSETGTVEQLPSALDRALEEASESAARRPPGRPERAVWAARLFGVRIDTGTTDGGGLVETPTAAGGGGAVYAHGVGRRRDHSQARRPRRPRRAAPPAPRRRRRGLVGARGGASRPRRGEGEEDERVGAGPGRCAWSPGGGGEARLRLRVGGGGDSGRGDGRWRRRACGMHVGAAAGAATRAGLVFAAGACAASGCCAKAARIWSRHSATGGRGGRAEPPERRPRDEWASPPTSPRCRRRRRRGRRRGRGRGRRAGSEAASASPTGIAIISAANAGAGVEWAAVL